MDDVAVGIGQDLDFDVTGVGEVCLKIDGTVLEMVLGLRAGHGQGRG